MSPASPSYKDYRYPVEIIAHRARLYFRFRLGFREVEEPMFEPGVLVSHETVRRWCEVRAGLRTACAAYSPGPARGQ
ncbi:hypothetical protein SHIRM173S_10064 [Streptomyces hirsutus]